MIPDHLIDQAAAGIDQFLAELQRGDWDNYPDLLARAALEAVAADIWDDGYEAGRDEDDGGGRLHPNPYERIENA